MKYLGKNILISLISGILFLCLSEWGLRLLGFGKVILLQPTPTLLWELKPNQNRYTYRGRFPVSINSKGFRGPEFTLRKGRKIFRILALGDSCTFGWDIDFNNTYTQKLNRMINSFYPKKVEVINLGIPGYDLSQMIMLLKLKGLDYQPDLILVPSSINDRFNQQALSRTLAAKNKTLRHVRLVNIASHFALFHLYAYIKQSWMVNILRGEENEDINTSLAEIFALEKYRRNLREIISISHKNNIKLLFIIIPLQEQLTKEGSYLLQDYHEAMRYIGKQKGVPVIDLISAFRREKARTLFLPHDPIHPSEAGHQLIAEKIAQFLKSSELFSSRSIVLTE
jgi:lysophospholipase L1-like esterase